MSNKLFTSLEDGRQYCEDILGKGKTFDIVIQRVHIRDLAALIVYVSGLVNNDSVANLLTHLQHEGTAHLREAKDENEYFYDHFNFQGMTPMEERDAFITGVLSGQVGFITKSGYCFITEFRNYPGRNPEEPANERVIRGARDGFAENIIINAALVRRRIRSPKLRLEMQKVSTLGETDVAICYMEDIANKEHLEWVKKRLEQIHHDGLTMADKSLEEWMFKQKFHPVPFVRYSERPDIVAAHLLEGHIAIIVDTSPSVILLPVSMFHLLMHAEEYRQAPLIGTVMRGLRYFAALFSLFLIPLWYLLATNTENLPEKIAFIGVKEASEVPLYLQLVLVDIGIEFLRIAAIHTPTPLSTAMGLIAGIMIGDIAINVGLFSPEAILYSSIAAVFTFAIPHYELSISVKVFRQILLAATALFAANGFFIMSFLIFVYLCTLRPMNIPYLWPVVPFFPNAFKRIMIRFPMADEALRPYIVGAKNRKRG
ncbi:spore germination protein [Lysinibacillus sp. KU-BSD001]|uniref:spore germination protein n=1 Tax=Lysinibacillus sp. KU-BSD001 TaxID=3141328 RepID=UPI0036E67B7C